MLKENYFSRKKIITVLIRFHQFSSSQLKPVILYPEIFNFPYTADIVTSLTSVSWKTSIPLYLSTISILLCPPLHFKQWLYLRPQNGKYCDNVLFLVSSILFGKNINIYFLTVFFRTTLFYFPQWQQEKHSKFKRSPRLVFHESHVSISAGAL